jgi:hypothetical protein
MIKMALLRCYSIYLKVGLSGAEFILNVKVIVIGKNE